MAATITITHVFSHKGGNAIFSGIVSGGDLLDKGWTKIQSGGQIDEIRNINNMHAKYTVAKPDKEYTFVCSKVYSNISECDEIMVQLLDMIQLKVPYRSIGMV